MDKAAIKKVQRVLKASGYDPGAIDGIWGPKTEAAVDAALAKHSPKVKKSDIKILDTRTLKNLKDVHQDLVDVVVKAAGMTDQEFIVTEGRRTIERQKKLVASGASRTMNSRHLTGHAIDVAMKVDGKVSWAWPPYSKFAKTMKKAAKELGVKIEWGGDWRSFKDGPHFQLSRKTHP